MKLVVLITLLLASSVAWGNVNLSRQWSRSTLLKPHLQFRYLNRMAPLLTETMVIQGNAVDGIKAFKRESGHEIWSQSFKDGVEGGAALDENRLYFGANDGHFYCLDVNTGSLLWKFELHSESLSKPLVQGQYVYHVTGNNTLYAFNKTSGESIWVQPNAAKSNMAVRGQTAPVYESGVLYLGFSDGSFSAFNAQNGRQLWSKRIGDDKKFNDVDATAVINGSCILVSSFANSLYCLDKNSGGIQWRHDFGGYNSVLVTDGMVYYPTLNGEIHLLDAKSGKLIRKVINVKGMATEPVSIENYIAYGESEGSLVIRRKSDLQEVGRFSPGLGLFARPTVDVEKDEIYILSNDANLYRLDLKEQPDNVFLWSREYAKK